MTVFMSTFEQGVKSLIYADMYFLTHFLGLLVWTIAN